MPNRDVIVVGTSAGGVQALQTIMRPLPEDLPAAVLIVAHTAAHSPHRLPSILARAGSLRVADPVDGMRIEPSTVYVAPPGRHLLVRGNNLGLSRGPKENRARPAIDPLFRSAAAAFGPRVIGVILTGMLDDGTAGLYAIREAGGTTVIQDPADAQHPSMPSSAVQHVGGDFVLPVAEIGPLLVQLVSKPTRATAARAPSPRVALENRFAELEPTGSGDMDTLGARAGLSCPECQGPLWRVEEGSIERFRCHVGHAYATQSMIAGQLDTLEANLWQVLRLMREREFLLLELRSKAEEEERAGEVAAYAAQLASVERRIRMVREMLKDEDSKVGRS